MSKKSLLTLSFTLTLALTIACTDDVNIINNSSQRTGSAESPTDD